MSSPSRYEKIVIVGLPVLLGSAFLVRLFTHGTVSRVALWVYLAAAVVMLAWVRRHDRSAARKPSRRERAILAVLAQRPQGVYGLDLSRESGLGPDRLFPALERMRQRGLVDAWWVDSWDTAGPRRRYYGLTDAGKDEHARTER
jgi:Transcriptional regulator PadR-like family